MCDVTRLRAVCVMVNRSHGCGVTSSSSVSGCANGHPCFVGQVRTFVVNHHLALVKMNVTPGSVCFYSAVGQWKPRRVLSVEFQLVEKTIDRFRASLSKRTTGSNGLATSVTFQPVASQASFNLRSDQTRTGHILGDAARRSEAPERQLTLAQSCILRLLTHLTLLQGATRNQRVRLRWISPSRSRSPRPVEEARGLVPILG